MQNNFMLIAGVAPDQLSQYFSDTSKFNLTQTDNLILASWLDPTNKAEHQVHLELIENESFNLTLGTAEIPIESPIYSHHTFQHLSPGQLWANIENVKNKSNITGSFAALQHKHGLLQVAADINASISIYWAVISNRLFITTDFWLLVSFLPRSAREINRESLYETIALNHCVGEATLLTNIHRLAPGHKMSWDIPTFSAHSEIWSIWQYNEVEQPEPEACIRLEETLLHNIEHMLLTDQNPALLLSGGVDSGTVFGMISNIAGPVTTPYTVRFAGSKYDETAAANQIAKRYNNTLETIEINYPDMFDGALRGLSHCHDPAYSQNMLLEYIVQEKIAGNNHNTLWDGDFADALFGPLAIYQFSILRRINTLPKAARKLLIGAAANMKMAKLQPYLTAWQVFGDISLEQYTLQNGFNLRGSPQSLGIDINYNHNSRRSFANQLEEQDLLNRFMVLSFYLADRFFNAKSEAFGRSLGLNTRKPFIRTDVIHEASKLKKELRFSQGIEKCSLRKVAENYLPKDIIYATKVTFDSVSHNTYITEDNRWIEYFSSMKESSSALDCFDRSILDKKVESCLKNPDHDPLFVWRMVTLDLWYKKLDSIPERSL